MIQLIGMRLIKDILYFKKKVHHIKNSLKFKIYMYNTFNPH